MTAGRPPRACRATRDRLALQHYGELPEAERFAVERHLEGCAGCRLERDRLRAALDAVAAETVFPRESEVDWTRFARLAAARARAAEEARGAGAAAPVPGVRPRPARLWLAAAAAAAVAVVLLLWTARPGAPPQAPATPQAPAVAGASIRESARVIQDRLARRGAARYLSDSRAVLVNLVGPAEPCRRADGRYDITLEKEKSRQLLRRKNLYEGELDDLEDQRLATLMRQLESVLMQVSALDDCASARQIHDLREQIETRQILLRIDLLTREMHGRTDVV